MDSRGGAAFALFGGGAADFFNEQGADAAFGIVTRNARETGIDDVADAVDGNGSFGDVGGDDDFAKFVWREGPVLIFRR